MLGTQHRARSLLLSALVLASAGGPRSRSWAQEENCLFASDSTTPLRVEDSEGAAALGDAVNCLAGGTVEAVWAGAVTLGSPISVGSGTFLSITGEDDLAEVRGGSQTRLFDVSPSGGLSLTRLKLSGGSAENGGAVYSSGATVTLNGCVFDGNNATAGDGGAVWAEGGDLTIIGGEFSGNSASENGGAVLAVDAGVVIQDGAVFEENTATREGGALYCGGTENSSATASCSVSEAVFSKNQATSQATLLLSFIEQWTDLYGGGAAAFYRGVMDVTNSVFEYNYAQIAGGAIFGGVGSDVTIDGCTFENNWTPGYGGAVAASSAALGGSTVVLNNQAAESGGGVFGWDSEGSIEFNDVVCSSNSAEENGGCFNCLGAGVINTGAAMQGNFAGQGGCIYAAGGSDLVINGGEFSECRVIGNGGFLFASDGAVVTIAGGTVTKNVAERRGGAVYCSGDSFDLGGSKVTIAGGTFSNNEALELAGAILAWGASTVVTVTGGVFRGNTAKYYGGFVFLEEGASLTCQGATAQGNYAGDQGGAIYSRDATWVNSSCDLIGNEAPQGAAAYLTHTVGAASFENHEVTDNIASGGSVLYAIETSVLASGVNFQSSVGLQEDSSNRAVQLEGNSTFHAEGCAFGGWMGDTVVHSASAAPGSLILNSCDFAENLAVMMVASYSEAEIRNAFISDRTFENAITSNDSSLLLVYRALDCGDADACGPGECVDSDLGVLCECLEDGACLDDGGALSIGVETPPPNVTYSPDPVQFELVVSAAADGTTAAIWNLTFEADDLDLTPYPSSGVLPPGENVTVTVTGTPSRQDVGGTLASRFVAKPVGSSDSVSAAGVEVEVESAFYFCQAFEYAMPLDDGGVMCEQCVALEDSEGLDCEQPGATLATLPVLPGYWRSSPESEVVHSCIHPDACGGATQVSSSDDYCEDGYEGPYCAVCDDGYGKGAGYTCHACSGTASRALIAAGSLFLIVVLLVLVLTVVFLVGGLDAVEELRRQISTRMSALNLSGGPVREISDPAKPVGSPAPAAGAGAGGAAAAAAGGTFAPAFNVTSEAKAGESSKEQSHEEQGAAAATGTAWGEDGSGEDGASGPTVSSQDVSGQEDSSGQDISEVKSNDSPSDAGAEGDENGNGDGEDVDVEPSPPRRGGKGNAKECCGLGERVQRWWSRLPMDKLKILVVVWQILTAFASITAVDFPPVYSRFLSWIDVVNFDVGQIFSASCLFPEMDFYQRLLLTTLLPIVLAGALVLTYQMAKLRAGDGPAGSMLRRAAWSRHMAAGLLLTFLVFTSTSTIAFKTFACDDQAVEGESYLRADYTVSCKSDRHAWYRVYAGIMILVYPVGIPLLYAFILWVNRESLNPRLATDTAPKGDGEAAAKAPVQLSDLEQKLEERKKNPDLVPSMFLWKDFGPDLYYYEVIECGRRILLTGVLIFIAPYSASQAAAACMFAFLSLLGFELLRPHLDPADSWLYRLGCVIIFLSNFLALLIKVEATERNNRVLGELMVVINVFLILAVLLASWFSTQQTVDDHRDGETALNVAGEMLLFEQLAADSAQRSRAALADRSMTSAA